MVTRDFSTTRTKRAVKFFLIVLAGTLLALLLHQVHHDPLMTLATKARSSVITSGYFPAAASASLALAFGIIGWMFLANQSALRGTGMRKGMRFGLALGGMYLVGMVEAYVVYPVPLFGEIYTGLADGAGILLTCLLLGKYLAYDSADVRPEVAAIPAVLTIAVGYLAVRYFSYTVLRIESAYATRPLATLLWTAGMGCWIGIMYLLAGRELSPAKPARQALIFGGLVFGINWLAYNLFVLLFIQVPVSDLLYRSLFDTLAVIGAVYLSARLSARRHPRGSK